MIVEFAWTITSDDFRELVCYVCKKSFTRGCIEIVLVSDSDRLFLGESCPACLRRGCEYMEREMRFHLDLSAQRLRATAAMARRDAEAERRASMESLRCPSFEEYQALEAGCAGPRYATREEAADAWHEGLW